MVRRKEGPSSRPPDAADQDHQALWTDLHSRLGLLATVQRKAGPAVEEANAAITLASVSDPDDGTTSARLDTALEAVREHADEEEALLNGCLERLTSLVALREGGPDGRQVKKRRVDTSPVPSLGDAASSHRSSPLPSTSSHGPLPVTLKPGPSSRAGSRSVTPAPATPSDARPAPKSASSRAGSRSATAAVAVAPPSASTTASTTARMPPKGPLQPGREVAFRRPGTDEWIMAKIVRSLGDKNRYEVQDVEPPEDGSAPANFTATLRSLIPLPIKDQPETYPSTGLGSGTLVLALYPDTTSFYKGWVKSGPSAQGRKYKVWFEDDDNKGAVAVAMELVVPYPTEP